TRDFFARRSSFGCDSSAPIFVIGMQRAGSTLVEQILGSHTQIEATAELPDITLMAEHFGETATRGKGAPYPDALAALDSAASRKLGESYVETTRFRRRLERQFFVDKNP